MLGLLDGNSVRQSVWHLAATIPTCLEVPSSNTWAICFPNILEMNTDTVSLQQYRSPCVYKNVYSPDWALQQGGLIIIIIIIYLFIYLLQLGCYVVAVVVLHVCKI